MIKTVGIVSLSSGIVGESFIRFESDIGIRRLKEYGLNVKFMPHALMGLDYIKAHPEKRAEDLLQAFRDPEIDMILCAIGGDDTYRLLPYLFDHNELAEAVTDKVFLGFSDTTINHLMLHKVGLNTFYGQAFLPDICELSQEMHTGYCHADGVLGHCNRAVAHKTVKTEIGNVQHVGWLESYATAIHRVRLIL